MKKTIALLSIVLVFMSIVGCSNTDNKSTTIQQTTSSTTENQTTTNQEETKIKIIINGKTFMAELYDNETAKALQDMLPLGLNLIELNGNEKYCYLSNTLPADSSNVDYINEGDIMLYGDNCLVLFYDSFSTSYSYTKIGHIADTTGLKQAVGAGEITVEIL